MSLYRLLRPLLFTLDAESTHRAALAIARTVGRSPLLSTATSSLFHSPDDPVEIFGLRFRNRIGLAAGFDKNGSAWRGLASLGFGHIELGTVTPQPQAGNPRPRIFRYPQQHALINRMGFPNDGAARLARNLAGRGERNVILGINLGINKHTPIEHAADDYLPLMERFHPLVDYLAINVSSPNTPGLRDLQGASYLDTLIQQLTAMRDRLNEADQRRVPLLVKLSPDLRSDGLRASIDILLTHGIDGAIISNTTTSRPNNLPASEAGGLSGRPLAELSLAMVEAVHQQAGAALPIVGAGGVATGADAQRMLDAGCGRDARPALHRVDLSGPGHRQAHQPTSRLI